VRIHLFVPCYVDHFAPEVAWASARILQRLGHEVVVPESQTCCGQAGYNSGYREESIDVATQWLRSFSGADAIVGTSGSCIAFIRNEYPEFFEGTPYAEQARAISSRTWELSAFLVDVLQVEDLGAVYPGRATFHDGCHGLRQLNLGTQARRLLSKVRGLELVEMDRPDLCCGFGGSFSIKLPELSVAMADEKLKKVQATGAELVISTEPTCLTQIVGRARRRGIPLRAMHLAEVLDQVDGEPSR